MNATERAKETEEKLIGYTVYYESGRFTSGYFPTYRDAVQAPCTGSKFRVMKITEVTEEDKK